jgi:hypothetical protein
MIPSYGSLYGMPATGKALREEFGAQSTDMYDDVIARVLRTVAEQGRRIAELERQAGIDREDA